MADRLKFDAEFIERSMRKHRQWQIDEAERLVREILEEGRKLRKKYEDRSMERTYVQR
jgi:hypothetical protein